MEKGPTINFDKLARFFKEAKMIKREFRSITSLDKPENTLTQNTWPQKESGTVYQRYKIFPPVNPFETSPPINRNSSAKLQKLLKRAERTVARRDYNVGSVKLLGPVKTAKVKAVDPLSEAHL